MVYPVKPRFVPRPGSEKVTHPNGLILATTYYEAENMARRLILALADAPNRSDLPIVRPYEAVVMFSDGSWVRWCAVRNRNMMRGLSVAWVWRSVRATTKTLDACQEAIDYSNMALREPPRLLAASIDQIVALYV